MKNLNSGNSNIPTKVELNTVNMNEKQPFLVRQIIVKGRNNQELFQILQNSIIKESVQVIASPRIDVAGNAYYWLGVRFDRFELDFKLLVNQQIMNYIFSYLKGDEELPDVTDFTPEIPKIELSQWIREHEHKHFTLTAKCKEELQIGEGKNYLVRKLVFQNGKFIYPSMEVEDILSLIMID